VVEVTGAYAVLSSTWRYDSAGLFGARRYAIPFDDILPDVTEKPRSEEIAAWLSNILKLSVSRFSMTKMMN